MRNIARFILIALCIVSGSLAMAESRYVTDELKITLRRGESTGHKVIKMLRSGTKVDVLSVNDENGYARVRTADGTEGYVLARMLKQERPARDKLAAAEKKLEALRASPDKVRQELVTTKQDLDQVTTAYSDLRVENKKLGAELATLRETSKAAVETAAQRDKLASENASLIAQVEELKRFKENLQNDDFRRWFLVGAAVLLVGILLGLLLPKMRKQRRGFGGY